VIVRDEFASGESDEPRISVLESELNTITITITVGGGDLE